VFGRGLRVQTFPYPIQPVSSKRYPYPTRSQKSYPTRGFTRYPYPYFGQSYSALAIVV